MYTRAKLIAQIRSKKSFLCVGLDTDIQKIPKHLLDQPDPIFAFNKAIIDATREFCVSYKINTAFFEAMNTSDQYAKAFFETLGADSVTLAPYMGNDSIAPFFKYQGKFGIVLALTSNPGSADYEQQKIGDEFLFEKVLKNTCQLGTPENLMFVVGATKPQEFEIIRQHAQDHFLLVPGVGAQGGSLTEVVKFGRNADIGLLINASRSIIYASSGEDFADAAALEARTLQEAMAVYC